MTRTAPTATVPAPTWRTRGAYWWLVLSALAVAVFAPLPYLLTPLADLGEGVEVAANYAGRSAPVQLALYLHVGAGGLALLLSPVQFATRLRQRAPRGADLPLGVRRRALHRREAGCGGDQSRRERPGRDG